MSWITALGKAAVKYGPKIWSKGKKAFKAIDTMGEFVLNGQRATTRAMKQSGSIMTKAKAVVKGVESQKAAVQRMSTSPIAKAVNSNFVTRNGWAAVKNVAKVGKELITLHPKRAWKALNGNLLLQSGFLYGFGVPATIGAYKEEGVWGAMREGAKQFLMLVGGTAGMSLGGMIPKVGFITGFMGWGAGEKAMGAITTAFVGKSYSEKKEHLVSEYGVSEEDIEELTKQGHSLEEIGGMLEENRQFEKRALMGTLTDDDKAKLKGYGYSDEQIEAVQAYKLTKEDIEESGYRPEDLRTMLLALDVTPEDIKTAKAYGKTLKDLVEKKTNEVKDKYGITDDDLSGGAFFDGLSNAALKVLSYMNLDFNKYNDTDKTMAVLEIASTLEDYGITKEDVQKARESGKTLSILLEDKDKEVRGKIVQLYKTVTGEDINDEAIDELCQKSGLTVPQLYAAMQEEYGADAQVQQTADQMQQGLDASSLGKAYAALSPEQKGDPNNAVAQRYHAAEAEIQAARQTEEAAAAQESSQGAQAQGTGQVSAPAQVSQSTMSDADAKAEIVKLFKEHNQPIDDLGTVLAIYKQNYGFTAEDYLKYLKREIDLPAKITTSSQLDIQR